MEDGELKVRQGGKDSDFVMVQETLGIIHGPFKDGTLRLHTDENGRVFAVGFGGRMLPRIS